MYFKREQLIFLVKFRTIELKRNEDSRIEEFRSQIAKIEKKIGIKKESPS